MENGLPPRPPETSASDFGFGGGRASRNGSRSASGGGAGNYVETDPTDPVTVYGKTIVQAEDLLLSATPEAAILRIARRWPGRSELPLRRKLDLWSKAAALALAPTPAPIKAYLARPQQT